MTQKTFRLCAGNFGPQPMFSTARQRWRAKTAPTVNNSPLCLYAKLDKLADYLPAESHTDSRWDVLAMSIVKR